MEGSRVVCEGKPGKEVSRELATFWSVCMSVCTRVCTHVCMLLVCVCLGQGERMS